MYLIVKGCNSDFIGNKMRGVRMWIMVEVMGYQLVIYVILLSGQELLNYLYRRLSIAKMCFILYIMNNVFLSEHSSQ